MSASTKLNAGVAGYDWRSSSLRLQRLVPQFIRSAYFPVLPFGRIAFTRRHMHLLAAFTHLWGCRSVASCSFCAFNVARPLGQGAEPQLTGAGAESAMRATKLTGGDPDERVETA